MKEEEDILKKEQQLFDQFSPVEGSTKTFPPDLLQNRQQNTPNNVYSQSASEVGSASSWTPQFTFPRTKSKIKNEIDVDPVLIESRFAKLLALLNRKKELSRNMSSTKHRKNSLNAANILPHTHQQSIQKVDDPNSELPFLSGPEIGGGELARQKRKGVGEEPKLRKNTGEEPEKRKETREELEVSSGEEAKKRRSAAPPEEEDVFNQIAYRENKNNQIALEDNYNVNHRDIVEYGNAKRNHLEDFKSKEDQMRGSNSILRMSHLLHPSAGNENQVKIQIRAL